MPRHLLERTAALTTLNDALSSARAGHGRVALVRGEAGIGKTSVLRAFRDQLHPAVRVLAGACDDLVSPRPLGALKDAVSGMVGELLELLSTGSRDQAFSAMLAALGGPVPTVLIIEDLHWADDATLDLLGFLARRVHELPTLLVLSFRPALPAEHPLHRLLGSVTGDSVVRLTLAPLSTAAVSSLAAGSTWNLATLHRLTAGNPFYVTEILANPSGGEVPETIAEAVLTRTNALSADSRAAVQTLSVVPGVVEFELATGLLGPLLPAVAEAEAVGIVEVGDHGIAFRHELARRAVHAVLPRLRQRELHLATVDLLLATDRPDLARVVHHAIKAGDARAVVRHAPAAGREAVAAGSHRQALELFAAALHHSDLLPPSERARLLDEHAWELYNAHEFPAAVRESSSAVGLFETLGDRVRHGEALVRLSRHHFMAGDTDSALRASAGAVAVLEPTDRPSSTAYALTNHGSLLALGEDPVTAAAVLATAHQLATQVNRLDLVALCLNYQSIAVADLADQERIDLVTRSLQLALEQHHHEHTARGYTNLAELLFRYGRIDELERCVEAGLAFVTQHGFRSHGYNLEVHRCLVWLRRGQWAAAEDGLLALVDQFDDPGMLGVYSVPVLARLRMRRGELTVGDDLQRLWRQALDRRSLLGLAFAGTALVEWAWLADRPDVTAQVLTEWEPHATRPGAGPVTAELLRYARRLEVSGSVTFDQLPQPWAAGLRGDWHAAALGWQQVGDPYEQALELAESADVEQTLVALRLLDGLGATVPARLVRDRLRRLGLRAVPRGPQSRTRSNPAGLTGRQLDVLTLVAQDRTNAQIAAELVLSVRTVDHHVATILTKLGVASRREAAAALAAL